MKHWISIALLVWLGVAASAATTSPATTAASTEPSAALPRPTIAITVGEEEGKKVVRALVMLDKKPLENAAVTVSVRRTFGLLPIGKDTTLDDGTAVAPFPSDLPVGHDGELRLVAEVAPTAKYGAAVAETTLAGGVILQKPQDPFPRALWAPRAPLQLLVPIFALIGGVWITYAFVLSQLIAIYRGARR